MILVPLLNPKFANALAARSCELRVRGTSARRAISALASSTVGVRNRGKGGKCNMPHSGP
jgi:hypothetical protein